MFISLYKRAHIMFFFYIIVRELVSCHVHIVGRGLVSCRVYIIVRGFLWCQFISL